MLRNLIFRRCFNLEKLREKESSKFVDYLEVKIRGGSGGNGCCSFLSDHRKEFAGPDGANGGNGGHVIFEATTNKKSLSHLSSSIRGNDGAPGRNKKMLGANAKHIKIHVPVGTLIKEKDKICADLSTAGEKYIACRGGVGGLGNLEFVSSTNNAPEESTKGSVGEQRILSLELKSIADIGLIGFPNAGKSSLLRAISNAKPLVAAYPFTTLNPHIGVVEYADSSQVFVADIPGLIKGAHRNEGLGHAFLRHIQRCHTLLYVLDLDSSEKHQLSILRRELELFDEALSKVPFMVIGNKIDLPGAVQKISDLQMLNKIDILPVSALLKINIEELKWKLKEIKNSS